ncbi:hypothetical protein [Nitrososphaera sp.]|uniref:hypothetical protein n=1 Tax=Nitrososphaera sp. TaxID=1971748 RepID=UPI00307D2D4E
MNIVDSEVPSVIVAKTCGSNASRRVTYSFVDPYHEQTLDKKEILLAELEACERLLKYASDPVDRVAAEKEISELKTVLDLLT